MPILCSEKTLWQLARYVPSLLIVEQVNDVSPQETAALGQKELNTQVLECSFFVDLVLCRLLRDQTKPARNWTCTSPKLSETLPALTQSLFKTVWISFAG